MDFEITDYNYIGSSIGNAMYSGLTLPELWSCTELSQNREQLDTAVSATIRLKELCGKKK